jgi:formyltetrahydrofolate deformylase
MAKEDTVISNRREENCLDRGVNGVTLARDPRRRSEETVTARPPAETRAVLTGACADATGVLGMVLSFLADRGIFPSEIPHFTDRLSGRFFLRVAFDVSATALERLSRDLAPLAARLRMDWAIRDAAIRDRTLIMASRAPHCLGELLRRWEAGLLPLDIRAIVSNHADLAPLAELHGIPFHHLPVTPETKRRQEAQLERLIAGLSIELVVLARYMQILSPDLCKGLQGRCINIHHSLLPSFKGAKPYHQAHARGVKLIGATAHYVVADLDDGPIIEQVVERVDHSHTPADLATLGSELERTALARAVQWHAERRVLLNGSGTVVFNGA